MEEREAVERLKRGDVGGLEALVRRYHTRAVRAAYLIVRDRTLAEDVAQGAFVRAYEHIGGFDADRPFGPWFMKIVINGAIKVARGRERMIPLEEGEDHDILARLADPGEGPHGLAEETETQRRVWEAMEKLPPAQRTAIVQRYYLGMSEAEMAEEGDAPQGTIKWRLHAARKSLSRLLRPQFRAEAAPATRERSAHELETPEGGDERG